MGPLDYFLRVLVNIIMAMVLGSLMIGLFGLLVAGQEGLVNGMVWGAAFEFSAGWL